MSEISPDLKRRRWNWQSIGGKFLVLSIIVHLTFLTGATVWVVQTIQYKRKQTFLAKSPGPNAPTRALEHSVRSARQKTMSAPMQAKRVTANVANNRVALPEMPNMPTGSMADATSMPGMGGIGVGPGMGGGGLGGGMGGGGGGGLFLPRVLQNRCTTAGRIAAMKQSGGKDESEKAVVKALQWLKRNQNGNGSWGQSYPGAMTGLAILCFLGHCEQQSPEYTTTVRRGIDFLLQEGQKKEGSLVFSGGNAGSYQHGIAAYALAEAYTMLNKDKTIAPVLTDAIGMIVNGQKAEGGWAYQFGKGKSDTSVSGWQIQALKAAHYTGLEIPGVDKALDKSVKYLKESQGIDGTFAYNGPISSKGKGKWSLTGVGVLGLQFWGKGTGREEREGIKAIFDGPSFKYKSKDADLYAWYYHTQACLNAGGTTWAKWNTTYQDELVKYQNDDGSWQPTGSATLHHGGGKGKDADVWRTTMCTLMLEVFYRYLPGTKGKGGEGPAVGGGPSIFQQPPIKLGN